MGNVYTSSPQVNVYEQCLWVVAARPGVNNSLGRRGGTTHRIQNDISINLHLCYSAKLSQPSTGAELPRDKFHLNPILPNKTGSCMLVVFRLPLLREKIWSRFSIFSENHSSSLSHGPHPSFIFPPISQEGIEATKSNLNLNLTSEFGKCYSNLCPILLLLFVIIVERWKILTTIRALIMTFWGKIILWMIVFSYLALSRLSTIGICMNTVSYYNNIVTAW